MLKTFHSLSCIALAVSIWSCGDKTNAPSQIKEAPDAVNAYSRIGLSTKPYQAVRATGQNPDMQKLWSGYYWAHYKGGVSYRWQQSVASTSYTDYLYNINNFQTYSQLQSNQLRALSPSEKWDLWMNDASMRVTWAERQKVLTTAQNYGGKIPTWFGICDGWALATSMEAEPVKMVRAQNASGQVIEFYPEDIKALMSYYYATAPKQFVMAGGRCNRETVTKDADGRVIESECRDVNPSTFHLALDRYVGDNQKKLIVDISRDQMVWNYPVQSYQFQYNNLRRITPDYHHAAPNTQFLVDVAATLNIVAGISPTAQLGSHRALDQKVWRYVLELDGAYNIIGGEWISDQHPDFMWLVSNVTNSSRIDYRSLSILAQAARN